MEININEMTVNELLALKNRIEGLVAARIEKATAENTAALIAAVKNLSQGVGKGFVSKDYYAETRYYLNPEDGTAIKGAKNIRFEHNMEDEPYILVKITSEAGKLLPSSVTVGEDEYDIVFTESRHYDETCDY